jgi:hypothetical protein
MKHLPTCSRKEWQMSGMLIGSADKANNIIALVHFQRPVDPAVEAKARADAAGEDDVTRDEANADLEAAQATTLLGMQAQFGRVRLYLAMAHEGHVMTSDGWFYLLGLLDRIDQAFDRFVVHTAKA